MFTHIYSCGAKLNHEDDHVGKLFRCPQCDTVHCIGGDDQKGISPYSETNRKTKKTWWKSFIVWIKGVFKRKKPKNEQKVLPPPTTRIESKPLMPTIELPSSKLKSDVDELIRCAWKFEETRLKKDFLLHPETLKGKNVEGIVKTMLQYADKNAPGLHVPIFVPHTIYTLTGFDSAGSFQEDDEGFVTLKIGQEFKNNHDATCAVLAHEICHYILNNSGIRRKDTADNEQLTDVCMFVLGFGTIFLNGYKNKIAQNEYRFGHRLGYLTDADYQKLYAYVLSLRQESKNDELGITLNTQIEQMKLKLTYRFHNRTRLEENIVFYTKKYPHLNEYDILEKMLIDFER